jgi:alpha-amylase
MWPGDMEAILSRVGNLNTDFGFPAGARPYVYMEVIDLGIWALMSPPFIPTH